MTTHCPICNSKLIRTRSGVLCPDGHGRLIPVKWIDVRRALTVAKKEAKAKYLASLPVARKLGWAKMRCGNRLRWRRVWETSLLGVWRWSLANREGCVECWWSEGKQRVWLRRIEE